MTEYTAAEQKAREIGYTEAIRDVILLLQERHGQLQKFHGEIPPTFFGSPREIHGRLMASASLLVGCMHAISQRLGKNPPVEQKGASTEAKRWRWFRAIGYYGRDNPVKVKYLMEID